MAKPTWVAREPRPIQAQHKMKFGPVELHIGPSESSIETDPPDQLFQHLTLSVGRFSTASSEDCREHWPRTALALARKALDDFERSLMDPQQCATQSTSD